MSKASDIYNSLPLAVREQAEGVIIQTQITQLLIEKERLNESYRRQLDKINAHLFNCQSSLKFWEDSQSETFGNQVKRLAKERKAKV